MSIFFFPLGNSHQFTRNYFSIKIKGGRVLSSLHWASICIKYWWEGSHNLFQKQAASGVKCCLINQMAHQISYVLLSHTCVLLFPMKVVAALESRERKELMCAPGALDALGQQCYSILSPLDRWGQWDESQVKWAEPSRTQHSHFGFQLSTNPSGCGL